MSVMETTSKIVGVLHAQGQQYSMTSIAPQSIRLPLFLREHVLVFHCVVGGFVQPVIVPRNNFMITPLLETQIMDVKYLIVDEEEEPEDIHLYSNMSDSVE